MQINKQLFEDVLSGKLKGTFVLRNGFKHNSDGLSRNEDYVLNDTYLYCLGNNSYTQIGYCYYGTESRKDIVDFIPDTDMKENELTIEIPEGKTVDWEESKKQNKIVLKDKPNLSYGDVCKKLFQPNGGYYICGNGEIVNSFCTDRFLSDANNAASKHQLECILAKNKLANVAIYLNNGWKPSKGGHVFAITYRGNFDNKPTIGEFYFGLGENLVVFKTQKAARQAIEILGEETVKLALEPLGV